MLYQYFLTNTGKLIHKWRHYFPIYERHFSRFQNRGPCFWEIGVGEGGSLAMWKAYFGPMATIIGLDINPDCLRHEDEQCQVRIGDQADPVFLQSVIDEFGRPISASVVRQALELGQWDMIRNMVPASTLNYLKKITVRLDRKFFCTNIIEC